MGANSRRKGAAFERRIARWFTRLLGQEVFRQTDETQQGNKGDVRVWVTPTHRLVVQAKHMKQPSPWRALDEACEAATEEFDSPVACIRRHGGEDIVVMRPDVFAGLLTGNYSGWSED